MAGYSGTPLVKKLGFKENFRAALVNSPEAFSAELEPLPDNVEFVTLPRAKGLDLIVLFVDSQQKLRKEFPRQARRLVKNGMLWVAWPKRASGLPTDLSDNSVRQIGLDGGLVDVKVCAVNEVWSGLKFVYRLKDRKSQ